MRIEQLVLHAPGEDERVRFGAGMTVFSGLSPRERQDLIRTIIDALTGRLTNASIVHVDAAGRRVYSDRTGATYADDGSRAPSPQEVLGADASAVRRLLTLGPADLGFGQAVSVDALRAELNDARAQTDRRRAEVDELEDRESTLKSWQEQIDELTALIDRHDGDVARWNWVLERRRLDGLRAELNLAEQPAREQSDRRILDAVGALQAAGAAWADTAAAASELRDGLGPLPAVSRADIERVAATPTDLPADFQKRFDAWSAADDLHRSAAAELASATAPVTEPDDPLVAAFAALDQTRLWAVHHEVVDANEIYEQLSGPSATGAPTETEEAIEAAHLEVLSSQREVERLQKVGLAATAVAFVFGLLVLRMVHPALGLFCFALGAVAASAAVIVPRRRLKAAELVEEQALRGANADSWLGLHLRRLDDVIDGDERKRYETAAKRRAAAQVAWDEIAGAVTPADLAARADAVRAHAAAIDPRVRTRKAEEARKFTAASLSAREAAHAALVSGLEPYGFTASAASQLAPEQLATQLGRRIAAGEVARKALRLAQLEQREVEAGRKLDDLLRRLGFTDGTLESRLQRTIEAVTAARARATDDARSPADLRAEMAATIEHLRATARPAWRATPDPTGPPVDREVIEARRAELAELVGSVGDVDMAAARQRLALAEARAAEIEASLAGLAGEGGSLHHRLISRLGRTTHLQQQEETVPILVDDALREVPAVNRLDLLDELLRAGNETQVILLSDDELVARWARDRANRSDITVYEAGPAPSDEPVPTAEVAVQAQVGANTAAGTDVVVRV